MTQIQATEATVRATAAAIGRAALFDDKITDGDSGRLAAWAEALQPYQLDSADMLAAVTAYYQAEVKGRTIQVGDIVKLGRDARRDRAERESADDRRNREDWRDARMGLAAPDPALGNLPIGGVDGTPVTGAYQVNDALKYPCPHCNSAVGQTCWNHITQKDRKMPCLDRLKARARTGKS